MSVSGWFRFKGRSLFSWAFTFQRLTGVVLLIYLLAHLTYLSTLLDKTGLTYESMIAITVSRQFLVFDLLLVLCGVFHGVNGFRIILHEFGIAYENRKPLLAIFTIITVVVWLYASYIMYSLTGG
ncbi:MAG: succinate dehydrogenase [Archaeoglobus sp.]|uniref:succinate dehydrogenase n=1 Tax=Archaeoglobus sp. TaxID=1872626 RepID=UPI001DE69CE1|nr:succinate dehydrogenase [Archaeoglobus sp.]MBO8179390.1 succinate dehydrogenase [Archaeoglobus sp.]